MTRKKRTPITVQVSEDSFRRATEILGIFHRYEIGEALTRDEQVIYNKYKEAYDLPQKRMQSRIDALRASTIIPWQDYEIIIT